MEYLALKATRTRMGLEKLPKSGESYHHSRSEKPETRTASVSARPDLVDIQTH